jgi:hypothetical protein
MQGVGTVRIDLEKDPRELQVVPGRSELFEELAGKAFSREPAFPAPLPVGTLPPEELAALRALGYGGEESK